MEYLKKVIYAITFNLPVNIRYLHSFYKYIIGLTYLYEKGLKWNHTLKLKCWKTSCNEMYYVIWWNENWHRFKRALWINIERIRVQKMYIAIFKNLKNRIINGIEICIKLGTYYVVSWNLRNPSRCKIYTKILENNKLLYNI